MLSMLRWLCASSALLLLAPSLFGQVARSSDGARPLGVQECDTRCQTKETDCDLACDQVAACVDECKKASEVCAQKCRDAPPPAASGSARPAVPSAPTKKSPPAKPVLPNKPAPKKP